MKDNIIASQAFDKAVRVWYPWAMDLIPLAYMSSVMNDGGAVQFICADCATIKAGGDIAAYNEARGFDWRGAWIEPPEDDDDYEDYQERNGLVVGDPLYVLFGDGLTINQAVAVNPEVVASFFGVDVDEIHIENAPDPTPVEFDCATCGKACTTVDGTTLMDLPKDS